MTKHIELTMRLRIECFDTRESISEALEAIEKYITPNLYVPGGVLGCEIISTRLDKIAERLITSSDKTYTWAPQENKS